MTSMPTGSVHTSPQLFTLQDDNRTLEEIQDHLEKLNDKTFNALLPLIVFLSTLGVVGACGNLLVFLVYLKHFKVSATRVFVLEMAVWDLLANLLSLPLMITEMRHSFTSQRYFCTLKKFLGTLPIMMSYVILVCVALDRRRRICQPFRRQLTKRQAAHLSIFLLALSCAILLPFTILYGVRLVDTDKPGIAGTVCGSLGTSAGDKVEQGLGLVLVTSFFVGFVLTSFAYLQIWCQAYQQKKRFLLAGRGHFGAPCGAVKTYPKTAGQDEVMAEDDNPGKIPIRHVPAIRVSDDVGSREEPSCADTEKGAMDQRTENENCSLMSHHPLTMSCLDPENGDDTRGFCTELSASRLCSETATKLQTTTAATNCRIFPPGSFTYLQPSSAANRSAPEIHSASEMPSCSQDELRSSNISMDIGSKGLEDQVATLGRCPQDGRRHQKKRRLLSRTTLMMFVLTATSVVFMVPYIALTIAEVKYVSVHLSSLMSNVFFMARCFPVVNSVVNPFIYNFCNPKFRVACRRLLRNMLNIFRPQM